MKIDHLKDLTPDPRNARRHNPRNIGMIVDSLHEVGAARSIVIDEDGRILRGNGTVDAAAEAGIEKVQVVDVDGETLVAVRRTGLTESQKTRLALLDNRSAETAEWDATVLAAMAEDGVKLDDLFCDDELTELLGNVPIESAEAGDRATLADKFGVPPFSVLDARQGYWQARKRAWLALGIQSELGRGGVGSSTPPHGPCVTQNPDGTLNYRPPKGAANAIPGGSREPLARSKNGEQSVWGKNKTLGAIPPNERNNISRSGNYACPGGSPRPAATLGKDGKTVRGDGKGRGLARCFGQDLMRGEHMVGENGLLGFSEQARSHYKRLTWVQGDREDLDEVSGKILAAQPQSGTSIFDPVLCELVYRWFSPPDGSVLDPFAGGSVRGIVAAYLGRLYTGIDLRPEQIESNEAQARSILTTMPHWVVGDSLNVTALTPGDYDLIFSCPPYGDLERYSDDPLDLSTMDYPDFLKAYRAIIERSCSLLREDRFAVFTVGDIRDKKGYYRNFVSDTIAAFQDVGLRLYNEAILVTSVGSLPIRVGKQFTSGRKLGKTHQNVLVFVKGDARKATEACGVVEMGDWEANLGNWTEESAEGAEEI